MNGQDIITFFETEMDDNTELSTAEELQLANDVFQEIYRNRPWEWLKKNVTGNLDGFSNTPGGSYIIVPTDWMGFVTTGLATDNSTEYDNNAVAKVVYIVDPLGNRIPYQLVNYSDRRQYLGNNASQGRNGFCWYDPTQNRVVFAQQPLYNKYDFDYLGKPAAITLSQRPTFPDPDFDMIIVFGMKLRNWGIQLFDRSHSYEQEDVAHFDSKFGDLCYQNSMMQMN